jgi:hypothetical protein
VLLSAQRQPWTEKQNSSSHTHYPTIPVTPIEHHPINDLPSLSPIKQSTTLKLQKLLTYSSSKRGKKRHMISRTCFKSREPNPHSMGVEWVLLLQSGLCLHRLIMSVVQFSPLLRVRWRVIWMKYILLDVFSTMRNHSCLIMDDILSMNAFPGLRCLL